MVFRITPSLGPGIEQVGPQYYDAGQPGKSYQLGSKVITNNGRDAVYVTAAAALGAGDRVNLNLNTFVATANASGTHVALKAVPQDAAFHAVTYVAP